MKMYLVVEIKNNQVIWNDTHINNSREDADGRIKIYNKATKNKRDFKVMRITDCKLVS